MTTQKPTVLTIEALVKAPIDKVWSAWNEPAHVMKWNQASPDWHCPHGENDLRVGGRFSYRMEARDGSFGFDFGGEYDELKPKEFIRYHMDDNREVKAWFKETPEGIHIKQSFDAEEENSLEMQQMGWQSILDSFASYAEKL